MARPLRVEYPGALYHVMSRGNGYQNIFSDDGDRLKFLEKIKDAVELHNLIVHAYCLMGNHYHILVETPDANLSRAMRDINGNYTQWFNARHKSVGHLMQGRYKAFVIEKETYLLEVARYIVLNPVRDSMCNHPRNWNWSSYRATAEGRNSPDWLHTGWILGLFGGTKNESQKEYRAFVKDGMRAEDPYDDLSDGLLLGSPQFVHWVWENHTNGSEQLKEHPREQRIVGRPALDEIFEDVHDLEQRNLQICFARIRCGYLNSEIARYLKLSNSTVGKIVNGTYNT